MALVALSQMSCAQNEMNTKAMNDNITFTSETKNPNSNSDTATFGMGCFWCSEAIFQQIKGVTSITSGFSGGTVKNPSYREVCMGTTGHAEVVQVTYNPAEVSYDELLKAFWLAHDPTTLNRQGADEGTQYRSVIFYHSNYQKDLAEKYKKELDSSGAFNNPIVTEISPYTSFYKAEDYHQDYYNQNSSAPYCQIVIAPKLEKFKKVFDKGMLRQN
ncbi:MAG TPA: peptide-methionine (S)-S-oxide reductase [Bacteroidetes bacterium]|nr:peptide-methionine (S)-S-oxide reductase [Bacteroidota bacterium]